MTKISTSSFQKGLFIEFKGEPHQIIDTTFVNPGKGSAFVRTKLKGLKTGKVQEFTYKSGEKVEEIPMEVKEMQYLYKDVDKYYFMDKFTYEQYFLTKDVLGNFANFLKQGDIFQIITHEGTAVTMRFPKKVRLKVIESEEAVRGNTVMGAKKIVTLETGVSVAVPIFIKTGDTVAVDPETSEYLERSSS
ncbi:elongation factor P [Candidatus Gottesmanbacteria bacterium]|nr:elongation factor P [Candidatus Gottesmanbacteria bacterium]